MGARRGRHEILRLHRGRGRGGNGSREIGRALGDARDRIGIAAAGQRAEGPAGIARGILGAALVLRLGPGMRVWRRVGGIPGVMLVDLAGGRRDRLLLEAVYPGVLSASVRAVARSEHFARAREEQEAGHESGRQPHAASGQDHRKFVDETRARAG